MEASRALRLAVIGYSVLFALSVALAFAEDDILPPVLREWSAAQVTPLVPLLGGALGLLGTVVGCVVMLGRKRWGAWVHLYATALSGVCVAGMGPQVASAAMSTLDGVMMISSGLIYGLAFFTDALPPATKTPNKAPEPTPGSVTPRARGSACDFEGRDGARVAPAPVVAHL